MNAPKPFHTPLKAAKPVSDMENMLNGLAKLNFGPRPVLGDRTNVTGEDASKKSSKGGKASKGTLTKSAQKKVTAPSETRPVGSKAVMLAKLSVQASKATDNAALAALVKEFVRVLQMNSSRTLTKEASKFLDVLHKQLDDPSVFVKANKYVDRF